MKHGKLSKVRSFLMILSQGFTKMDETPLSLQFITSLHFNHDQIQWVKLIISQQPIEQSKIYCLTQWWTKVVKPSIRCFSQNLHRLVLKIDYEIMKSQNLWNRNTSKSVILKTLCQIPQWEMNLTKDFMGIKKILMMIFLIFEKQMWI